jgi:coniferyl-aldehyde dehydrogenase
MQAAAANLTPVTLELGGKSRAIIHESYPLSLPSGASSRSSTAW